MAACWCVRASPVLGTPVAICLRTPALQQMLPCVKREHSLHIIRFPFVFLYRCASLCPDTSQRSILFGLEPRKQLGTVFGTDTNVRLGSGLTGDYLDLLPRQRPARLSQSCCGIGTDPRVTRLVLETLDLDATVGDKGEHQSRRYSGTSLEIR